ncbi:polysaccharide pyruvyl transferase family protein [Vagococcus fluvialis]|uniref:polysaccharide pyruvyl transferase family protein n=1 Tax=Vagococcus fluvialis TaxID=2738 RepID=UPI0032E4A4ED
MYEKIKIRLINFINSNFRMIKNNYSTDEKKIFLLLTPLHGNIGDQAIAYSELIYLKENFPDYCLYEIPLLKYSRMSKAIKKYINKDDLIFLHGGGNLGDLYYIEEYYRRLVIKDFKYNRINSFPQSLAFNENSSREKRYSEKIYNNHENLNIVIRENKSLIVAKEIFQEEKISFYPDIVLYNKVKKNQSSRNNVLFLMRNDVEKIANDNLVDKIKELLNINNIKYDISDTQLSGDILINTENRFEQLENKLSQISDYNLIITDRLHGMILSYISGVSCIALNNSTKKVEATYKDWLVDAETIALLTNERNYTSNYLNDLILELYGKEGSDLSIQLLFQEMFR